MNKIVNYGLKALFLAGIVVSVSQAWSGRALPVAYNQQTGKWSVLLGLNKGGYWNDFGAEGSQGTKGNVVAQEALKNQTNSVYTIQIQGMPWYKLSNNDIIHFVPVTFQRGGDLYRTARNTIKEDFRWVCADDLMGQGDVALTTWAHGNAENINISRGLLAYFRQYWPHARGQLSTTATTQPSSTTTTQTATTSAQAGTWSPARNQGAIYFYNSGHPYYEFTNFQPGYQVNIGNKQWRTTEHYYQAMKFNNPQIQKQIRRASSARDAFSLARQYSNQVRADWHQMSLETMLQAVRAKFTQHPTLKNMLVNTGDKTLVEDAGANDTFFGAGADYNGQNYLGRILMHVRAELSGLIASGTPWAQSPWS